LSLSIALIFRYQEEEKLMVEGIIGGC
jgi:hypothetical protein